MYSSSLWFHIPWEENRFVWKGVQKWLTFDRLYLHQKYFFDAFFSFVRTFLADPKWWVRVRVVISWCVRVRVVISWCVRVRVVISWCVRVRVVISWCVRVREVILWCVRVRVRVVISKNLQMNMLCTVQKIFTKYPCYVNLMNSSLPSYTFISWYYLLYIIFLPSCFIFLGCVREDDSNIAKHIRSSTRQSTSHYCSCKYFYICFHGNKTRRFSFFWEWTIWRITVARGTPSLSIHCVNRINLVIANTFDRLA